MNKVILVGKIVSNIIKKSEKSPAEFRVETTSEWRGEKVEGKSNLHYHNCVSWGDNGTFHHKAYRKDDIVVIEGMLVHNKITIQLKDNQGNPVLVDGEPYFIKKVETEVKILSMNMVPSSDTTTS